jgi:hypothetical protein
VNVNAGLVKDVDQLNQNEFSANVSAMKYDVHAVIQEGLRSQTGASDAAVSIGKQANPHGL